MSEEARTRTYLDWNATAPPLASVLDAMREAAREGWGNPSSVHAEGRAARANVENARAAIAELASCDVRDVWLTSGGTEANNLALRSFFADAPADARGKGGDGVLLTSRLEHPSITRVAELLAREGRARVTWVAVKSDGRIDVDDLARALAACGDARALIALQAVNPETGVIQPVDDVVALARARAHRETRVHVDAVQAWGRVEAIAAGADSRSLAAHKIRGPKGIGALVTREGFALRPVLVGGAQERGVRPGTVDPIAGAGLAVAAAHAKSSPARYASLAPLRDTIERALLGASSDARVNGEALRAPHVTNVSFASWSGAELVAALDLEGVAVSSGSACSAGTIEPSPVVTSMLGEARAKSAVRVSLGEDTTRDDVSRAIDAFARVFARTPALLAITTLAFLATLLGACSSSSPSPPTLDASSADAASLLDASPASDLDATSRPGLTIGTCTPSAGNNGNSKGVGAFCEKNLGQCTNSPYPALQCGADLESGGPDFCVLLACDVDSDCGEDACCTGNVSAAIHSCVPSGCFAGSVCPGLQEM